MPTSDNQISIEEMVEQDPAESIRHFVRLESYVIALKKAITDYADKNGPVKKNGASMKKVTRRYEKLDAEKAAPILEEAGFDLMDVADIQLTEEAIIAKLGEENGKKVISELKASGATKVTTATYWRMQAR